MKVPYNIATALAFVVHLNLLPAEPSITILEAQQSSLLSLSLRGHFSNLCLMNKLRRLLWETRLVLISQTELLVTKSSFR